MRKLRNSIAILIEAPKTVTLYAQLYRNGYVYKWAVRLCVKYRAVAK